MSGAPAGRSFLNDAMEDAADRRSITTRAQWTDPVAVVDAELTAGAAARDAWAAEIRKQGLGSNSIPTSTPTPGDPS